MRVLVTGGCGFIGAAVVRLALERGDQILNIDRRRKSNPCPALGPVAGKKGYARLESDISDRSMMRAIFREFKPEAVIHLASAGEDTDEGRIFDSEVAGAFSILEASRQLMSSLDDEARTRFRIVHMQRADTEVAATSPAPTEAVRASGAALFDTWSHAHDLPLVTCIAGDVFGPWQPDKALFPSLAAELIMHRRCVLESGGETVRDWMPVRDLAEGLLLAASKAPALSRIEFSAGAERRDIDLAEALCSLLDIRSPLPGEHAWASFIQLKGEGAGASPGPMLDDGEAETLLGWRPRGFHAGLDRALNWAMTRYAPPAAAIAAE